MQLQLFSHGAFISEAETTYMHTVKSSGYAFKSAYHMDYRREFFKIYSRATRSQRQPFVSEDMVRYAIRQFYNMMPTKGHPVQVAKMATRFADEYNARVAKAMKLDIDLSQLKLPDFTTLTEIIEWFGRIFESFLKGVGGVWKVTSGVIFIFGLVTSPLIIGVPIAILGFISLILSAIGPDLIITVTKAVWGAIKGLLRALGVLERDRIIHNLVKDTFAYEALVEAINLIRQYQVGEKIPAKVTKQIKTLLEEVEVEVEDFHEGLKDLKSLAKKAQNKIDREKKKSLLI